MVDIDGHEGAGARHLLRRLRRPAGAVAGRHAARVDVEPRRRIATASCSSRSGTTRRRWKRSRTRRRESRARNDDETIRPQCTAQRRSALLSRSALVVAASVAPDAQRRRRPARTSRRSRRERLEGRLAGSNGERLAGDYLVAELQRIGAKPLPGPDRLPAAVRVHRRHARRRLDGSTIDASARTSAFDAAGRTCRRCRSPTTATSSGAGRLRRLRHRRARSAGLRLRQLRRRST